MKRTSPGFTLVETLVYLGLFGILMGGAVVAAFNIFQSAGREQAHAMLQEEGTFLMAKVSWAVSGAQSVNAPGGGMLASQLSVNKVTGLTSAGVPIVSTVVLTLSGTDVHIQDGLVPIETLNNTNVQVVRIGFLHTLASGNGVTPESIVASTTLSTRAPNGMVITQDFATTVYIKR